MKIQKDPENLRKHPDKNKAMIRKSLEKLGAGRSILIDGEGYIVAGNGVYEQADALGIPVRVIESNGEELIVVKRTDLVGSDPRRKELAIADNATSDSSEWDALGDWEDVDMEAWDIELSPIAEDKGEVKYADDLWFISIACIDERQCHQLYQRLMQEGLSVKIIR